MFIKFFNKNKDFLGMLIKQAEKVLEATNALLEFLSNISESNKKKILDIEKEADGLRKILVEELNKAFITPFDKEDIYAISRAIDDVVDYLKTTVEEMLILKVEPDQYIKKMLEALNKGGSNIVEALKLIKKSPELCREKIILAKKTENFVEDIYREGISNLFEMDDIKKILKTREVYRHLSNAADRLDEAANIIGDIVVKIS
ncbi:MAG: DUF47 family protein [Endomicrobiia bacterium]